MKIKIDKYDARFSKLIRTRDVVCQKCLRAGRLECSHIFGRRNKALRFDTRNAKGLCHTCHRWWHSNPADGVEWLKGVMGDKQYDNLRLMANLPTKAPCKQELDYMYDEMKAEIEYLESVSEEERVHLQFRNRWKK